MMSLQGGAGWWAHLYAMCTVAQTSLGAYDPVGRYDACMPRYVGKAAWLLDCGPSFTCTEVSRRREKIYVSIYAASCTQNPVASTSRYEH